jgi:translation elongation factor EF-1beta
MRLLAWAAAAAFIFLSSATNLSAQEDATKIKSLAPGVLKVIPTVMNVRDSYSQAMTLPGLKAPEYDLNYTPQRDTLKDSGDRTIFYRNVWQNEFAFTGLRQINVLMRYPDGSTQRKIVWYMVYQIRDLGKSLSYEDVTEEFGHVKRELRKDAAINDRSLAAPKLQMHFSLEGVVKPSIAGKYEKVVYGDSDDAGTQALAQYIQNIEDPNQKLHFKGELGSLKLPLAQSDTDPGLWGVAIWENVDPRLDYVSVYVRGLTNAYRIKLDADGKVGFGYKTLQLNFWRAGDEVGEMRDDIEYGIPLVDDSNEQVEICRHYKLPGPLLRGYKVSETENQNILVCELDAQVNLVDFTSLLTPQLDSGQIPEDVVNAFADAGFDISGAQLSTGINGEKWALKVGEQRYVLKFEPQYWKPVEDGIKFTKTLDHFWIYR